jgi:hypothetical protein
MLFWAPDEVPAFQSALIRLDAVCRDADVPVIHIFHVGVAGAFALLSGLVVPLPWLN